MIVCLRTRVHKQPIIALYFESETVFKFWYLYTGQVFVFILVFILLGTKDWSVFFKFGISLLFSIVLVLICTTCTSRLVTGCSPKPSAIAYYALP